MKAALKSWLKIIARALATVVLLPEFLSFALRSFLLGRDRALEGSSQTLALVPGIVGQYLRRAFLTWVLDYCHPSVTVEFGTIFSKAAARLEENVYIGPRCHLGWVFIERDVLIAAGVHIPSGPLTHGTEDTGTPIREQTGTLRMVRIGARSWIGSAAIVMADVGRDSVVGAGAVVTKPIADRVFAAGVPARVVRSREPQQTRNTIYEIGNLSK
jgi:acetyltransferase-like isoleucine patch superfamily enzyme